MGFLAVVGAVVQVAQAIKEAKSALDTIDTARSVVLIVQNYTDYTLRVRGANHAHGGWGVNPTGEIPGQHTDVFGAKDKGFMTGCEGRIDYFVLNAPYFVRISWNNPWAGSNSCRAEVRHWNFGVTESPELPEGEDPLFERVTVTDAEDEELLGESIPVTDLEREEPLVEGIVTANTIRVYHSCGAGNEGAEMRFEIRPG